VGPAYTGHFRVTADTPKGLQPFQPVLAMSNTSSTTNQRSGAGSKSDINLALHRDVYQSRILNNEKENSSQLDGIDTTSISGKKHKFTCHTCGVDCTKSRYHSTKTRAFEICPNCYSEGRFPSSMYSGDFVKMEEYPNRGTSLAGDDWTDQETLLLLEGLEMFDEDWDQIAEHVGTRTREQCILKFLQLPIEDPYIGNKMSELGPLQYQRIPFSQADNPVMSLVAFLASVVNPAVASAAAQSALKELGEVENKKKNIVNGETSKVTEKTVVDGKSTIGTEMMETQPSKENELSQPSTTDNTVPTTTATTTTTSDTITSAIGSSGISDVQRAAAAAIGAAAAKAKVLADYEEREIQKQVNALVELQLRKLEFKMQQFQELEMIVENEKKELEKQRQQLYLDRLAFTKSLAQMKMDRSRDTGMNSLSLIGPSDDVDIGVPSEDADMSDTVMVNLD